MHSNVCFYLFARFVRHLLATMLCVKKVRHRTDFEADL